MIDINTIKWQSTIENFGGLFKGAKMDDFEIMFTAIFL